jgi:hypothetical protein
MAKDTQLNWVDMDVDALGDKAKGAYEAYKTAQRAAAELRTQFEAMVNKTVAERMPGKKLVFGYRFGKLSAALVVAEEAKAKPAQGKMSLSDFLAGQAAQGRRT